MTHFENDQLTINYHTLQNILRLKKECEDDLIKLLEASNCACLAVFPSTCTPYIHLKTCHCLGSVMGGGGRGGLLREISCN